MSKNSYCKRCGVVNPVRQNELRDDSEYIDMLWWMSRTLLLSALGSFVFMLVWKFNFDIIVFSWFSTLIIPAFCILFFTISATVTLLYTEAYFKKVLASADNMLKIAEPMREAFSIYETKVVEDGGIDSHVCKTLRAICLDYNSEILSAVLYLYETKKLVCENYFTENKISYPKLLFKAIGGKLICGFDIIRVGSVMQSSKDCLKALYDSHEVMEILSCYAPDELKESIIKAIKDYEYEHVYDALENCPELRECGCAKQNN